MLLLIMVVASTNTLCRALSTVESSEYGEILPCSCRSRLSRIHDAVYYLEHLTQGRGSITLLLKGIS